ncbi:polyadenylate-specific 3'-exoribonuclease AS [Corynebacterium caspium]|uniref:polyadenylate-specific 3'-exoribonuclease AS n=1 Tax=Corynebacterium caspium TaxID=234828 RepID=UPI00036DFC14|nr:polyadenylate-specific 3'-exoribonuclease AS [Corynebacterium caspium]WKD58978.1 3'-5' exoribonuclease.1 [Corynebacterium caspium DSM 44850]
MRFFYDTEFIEDGRTIELVSIGVIAEDGREYYAVSAEFDPQLANNWVRQNVLDKLPNPSASVWKSKAQIREELIEFLTTPSDSSDKYSPGVELWAWVAGYDHVVLAQLWGDMSALPRIIPRYTRELKQYWEMAGQPELPRGPVGSHDALVDARYNLVKFKTCMAALPLSNSNKVLL